MPHPTDAELRAAGIDAHIERLRADLYRDLASTWRGRLALRLLSISAWRYRRAQARL